jgi:uncharacterized SAM-binding protein YcdF (DUF218 family)
MYKHADVVVMLEGDGYSRINKTCEILKEGYAKILIFSGGVDCESNGSYPFEKCLNKFIENEININDIILEKKSQNTKEQANEVIKLCLQNNWKKIILVASHYHQYRAFLTFLKTIIDLKLETEILIYNAPVRDISWFETTQWGDDTRSDLLNSELNKIFKYKNDVATYEQAINYYKWRETK